MPGRDVPAGAGPSPSPSQRRPAATSGRQGNVASDRASLGLGAAKPSEMIAGLEEVAKRAEKIEAREQARRKSGGRMSLTQSLEVDDTGKRWSRNVYLALFGFFVLIVLAGAAAFYFANRVVVDPRQGSADTRKMMSELVGFTARLDLENEPSPSVDFVKRKLHEQIEKQLQNVDGEIERERQSRVDQNAKHKPRDSRLYRERENLQKLLLFQDAWGQPLSFSVADEMFVITAKGYSGAEKIDPVSTRLKQGTAPKPK